MIKRAQWIGVAGIPSEQVLKRLGLVDTGQAVLYKPSITAYAVFRPGWTVVVHPAELPPDKETYEALSAEGQAVICAFDDASRFSTAQGFQRGELLWSMIHEGSGSQREPDLDAIGSLPIQFSDIADRLMADQAEAVREGRASDGLYRAPMELCHAVCGFRADIVDPDAIWPTMTHAMKPTPASRRRRLASSLSSLFSR